MPKIFKPSRLTPGGRALLGAALAVGVAANASAVSVSITIDNLSGDGGLFLTPMWLGFHDGNFDLYNRGEAVTPGLERLAEDGNNGPLSAEFAAATSATGGVDTTVVGPSGVGSGPGQPPIIDPGESITSVFDLDPAGNRFLSYASMVIPSNDAFIANGDPMAHQIFDDSGNFVGPIEILILGSNVLDAGTEVNNEIEAAFLNQTGPDTGDAENGVVTLHPGFNGSLGNPDGLPMNIIGGTNAAGLPVTASGADFTQAGFQVARISVNAVATPIPEPASLSLFGLGLGLLAVGRKRRKA